MTPFEHQNDPPLGNTLPDTNQDENDEVIIYVSKSEIKRDAEVLKKLGSELVGLSKNELTNIPLDDNLRYAVELAKKIKKEGYRRQIQYIGKLLRNRDIAPISQALDKLKNRHNQQTALLHKIEKLRDELIASGDAQPILALYPTADRQQLRHLARLAKKEQANNEHLEGVNAESTKTRSAKTKSAKQIFQYLKNLIDTA